MELIEDIVERLNVNTGRVNKHSFELIKEKKFIKRKEISIKEYLTATFLDPNQKIFSQESVDNFFLLSYLDREKSIEFIAASALEYTHEKYKFFIESERKKSKTLEKKKLFEEEKIHYENLNSKSEFNCDEYVLVRSLNTDLIDNLSVFECVFKDPRVLDYNRQDSILGFETLKTLLQKPILDEWMASAPVIRRAYRPFTVSNLFKESVVDSIHSDNTISILNTCRMPSHRTREIVNASAPFLVLRFLKDLFKTKKSFEFIMESLFLMTQERLQVVLVLNGVTGIGKNLFTDKILGGLFGYDNFKRPSDKWDTGRFNDWLSDTMGVILDETSVQNEGPGLITTNRIKRMCNDRVAIHKKNMNQSMIANTTSFFLTSNFGIKNFTLELDNRRFSPVDLTELKFEERYTPEEKLKLLNDFENKELMGDLYWYIVQNFNPDKTRSGRTSTTVLQCERLYYFQLESLFDWQRAVIDTIIERVKGILFFKESKEIEVSDVLSSYLKIFNLSDHKGKFEEPKSDSFFEKENNINPFLRIYKHRKNPHPVASFSNSIFFINDKFLNFEQEELKNSLL